jgi:hypothetical protein
MPTLRPIFKLARGHTHNASGYGTGQSGWSQSKRVKMSNKDGGGPFMTLSQPGSREEVDLGHWVPASNSINYPVGTYQVNAAVGYGEPERDDFADGIRRDVTVTVVYGNPNRGGELRV